MARPNQYIINLTEEERVSLEKGCKSGSWNPRKVRRAKTLLLADSASNKALLTNQEIAKQVGCSKQVITYLRKRFQTERLKALDEKSRSGRPKIVHGEVEAQMIAITCSEAPEGRERWTLRLIAEKLVTLVDELDDISYTTIGKTLKKMN